MTLQVLLQRILSVSSISMSSSLFLRMHSPLNTGQYSSAADGYNLSKGIIWLIRTRVHLLLLSFLQFELLFRSLVSVIQFTNICYLAHARNMLLGRTRVVMVHKVYRLQTSLP